MSFKIRDIYVDIYQHTASALYTLFFTDYSDSHCLLYANTYTSDNLSALASDTRSILSGAHPILEAWASNEPEPYTLYCIMDDNPEYVRYDPYQIIK